MDNDCRKIKINFVKCPLAKDSFLTTFTKYWKIKFENKIEVKR